MGLDIEAAEKGPKSREFGVKWLQNLNHIYIDINRTPNIWREFTSFEFLKINMIILLQRLKMETIIL